MFCMNKIIFLDVDGVLNKKHWVENKTPWIEESRVKLVSDLCNATGAKVVLSTNWREVLSEPSLFDNDGEIAKGYKLFQKYGIKINGITPRLNNREEEINSFIKDNNVGNWVVFDDNELHIKNFIHTDGLTVQDCDKALSILNTVL